MKLNKKANIWFTILKYVLVVILAIVIVSTLHAKIPEYGKKIGGFLGLIEPDVDYSDPGTKIPWLKDNAYAFIYIESDEEPDAGFIRQDKSKLVKAFSEYEPIGSCKMPKKVPGYLESHGCWVIGVIDDGFLNADNCGVHLYDPLAFTYIDSNKIRCVWADDGYQPRITQESIEGQCVSDRYCNSQGLRLLVDFYNTYRKSNLYSHHDDIYNKFFKGDLLCGALVPGEYAWVKCDKNLANIMSDEEKILNLFDKGLKSTVSFKCECTGDSCLWSEV